MRVDPTKFASRIRGRGYCVGPPALVLLDRLLNGPNAGEAAAAIVKAGGLSLLVATLAMDGQAGDAAASCIMKIVEGSEAHHKAVVASGAVAVMMDLLGAKDPSDPPCAKMAFCCRTIEVMVSNESTRADLYAGLETMKQGRAKGKK